MYVRVRYVLSRGIYQFVFFAYFFFEFFEYLFSYKLIILLSVSYNDYQSAVRATKSWIDYFMLENSLRTSSTDAAEAGGRAGIRYR